MKTGTDFETLLDGSFELCKSMNYEVILFCGYFYKASQIDFVLQMYDKYKSIIKLVIVDPILGDNNRLYVEKEILDCIPKLLGISDIALPNYTELKFLSPGTEDFKEIIKQFISLYPNITLIVKSIPVKKGWIGISLNSQKMTFEYKHKYINVYFGGTGDVFVSYFINNYIFKQKDICYSVKKAASQTAKCIKKSLDLESSELIIINGS